MRVLVTGGAGFIGSHLVKELIRKKHDVIVLDNFTSGHKESLSSDAGRNRVTIVKGDIRDPQIVNHCVKQVDSIVHLAAISSVPYSVCHETETWDVNVGGMLNLLRASARYENDNFVFASSSAVYGEALSLPTKENHPLSALSPYAESKIAGEGECHRFQKETGLQTMCLRLFNVYGTNHFTNYNGGVIAQFASKLGSGKPPVIFGDGKQTRDFVHVTDVIDALLMALEYSGSSETLNVGSGKRIALNELAKKMNRLAGAECGVPEHRSSRVGDIRHSHADTSLMASRLGFRPNTELDDGLRMVLGEKDCPVNELVGASLAKAL